MKNIISLIILTFALLIASNVESKGQCPTGYTQQIITINMGGCLYDVNVCYKCPSPTSHFPDAEVIVVDMVKQPTNPPCNNGWTTEQELSYARNYFNTGQFIWYFACLWAEIPPCPTPSSIDFHVLWPNCWKQDYTIWNSIPTTGMFSCGDSYCRTWTSYCKEINGDLTPFYQNNQPEGPAPTCPPFNQVTFGQCFSIPNPCFP